MSWRYVDPEQTIAARDLPNGSLESCLASAIPGETIAPYEPPAPTPEIYAAKIQEHIDATARARGYADAVACASYASSTSPAWAAEAAALIAWRDAVWLYAYQELAKVQAGQRQAPTVAAFLAELPAIAWPENA